MDRVRWIEVKGQKILYSDYSNLKTVEEQLEVWRATVAVAKENPGVNYPAILNFTNTAGSAELMEKMKQAITDSGLGQPRKKAVIGIAGVKNVLLDGYVRATGNKLIKACADDAEAIEFVTS